MYDLTVDLGQRESPYMNPTSDNTHNDNPDNNIENVTTTSLATNGRRRRTGNEEEEEEANAPKYGAFLARIKRPPRFSHG